MGNCKECVDHLGQKFASAKARAEHWGQDADRVSNRMKYQGWTLERALTTPARPIEKKRATKEIVVYGVKYKDAKEACRILNKPYNTIKQRLDRYTPDEAFSDDFDSQPNSLGEVMDHLGNLFPNFNAMCKHYKIKSSIVASRLKTMPLGEALTTPVGVNRKPVSVPGVGEFSPLEKAFKSCGITRVTYLKRIEQGMTPEQALTTPKSLNLHKIDIPGYGKFDSLKAACLPLGLSSTNVTTRAQKRNVDVEVILKEMIDTVRIYGDKEVDVFGKVITIGDASKVFNINIYEIYLRLIRSKMDIEAALVIPENNPDEIRFAFRGASGKGRYRIGQSTETYTSVEQIIDKYKPELLGVYRRFNPGGIYHPYPRIRAE